MDVAELAPGLWRWTAPHPVWTPADADDWARDVGCVYAEVDGALVLVDPLVPLDTDEGDRFWRALDRDVERLGAPLILTTVSDHVRSGPEIAERYGPPTRSADAIAGLREIPTVRFEEVVVWLEPQRALVAGDVLLGDESGGVAVCPADWCEGLDYGAVRDSLRPLLDLPVELVLVSHGEPVLSGGRAALAAALRHEL
jgi:glyoxylase-like metal-dependent hydrolase (beta-lactamase superfamily II)